MSDLNTKFTTFEEMINSNHLGITDGLAAILAALGGMPETTFDSLVTAIANTNTLLGAIHTDSNEKLDLIFNTLDVMNTNASLNAQRILALMLQTACACEDTAPLLPLPIDTTPTTAEDADKCQRIQYFLDVYKSWVLNVVSYLGLNGNIANYRVYNTLNLILDTLSVPDSELSHMPASTRDSISNLLNISGAATFINTALFDALNDDAFVAGMQAALYGADNAAAGKAAVDSFIAGSGISYASIASSMFWSGFANVIYSSVPIVDASGYDGSICAPAPSGCYTFSTEAVVANVGASNDATYAAVWPDEFAPTTLRPDGVRTWSVAVFARLDLGTQISLIKHSGATVTAYLYDADGSVTSLGNLSVDTPLLVTIPRSNTGVTLQGNGIAEVEACFVLA